jgi:hypothetical protein
MTGPPSLLGEAKQSSLPGDDRVPATPSSAVLNDPIDLEEPSTGASEPTLPLAAVAHLGDRLRAYYAHLMSDPVPDHLLRLIETLDGKGSTDHGA